MNIRSVTQLSDRELLDRIDRVLTELVRRLERSSREAPAKDLADESPLDAQFGVQRIPHLMPRKRRKPGETREAREREARGRAEREAEAARRARASMAARAEAEKAMREAARARALEVMPFLRHLGESDHTSGHGANR